MIASNNTQQNFDVVILGGGPAGTAAGITLQQRPDISVAIVEQSDYSAFRIGESLTPGIRSLLEYLKVWEPFQKEQSLKSFGTHAAWGSDTFNTLDYMFTIHGAGWSLDRVRFDQMLARTFQERGGTLLTNTRFLHCEPTADQHWQVQLKNGESLHCKYLIDATGRRSRLAQQLGVPRIVYDRLLGVSCVGQLPPDRSVEFSLQIEACDYGWWYTAPVPGNRLSVVLMSDSDLIGKHQATRPDRWHALLDQMPLTRQRVQGVEFKDAPKPFSCFSSCLKQVGGKNWVAVGDAAASHDPLSSTGIPHALGSGIHGAILAANTLFGDGEMLASFQQSIEQDFRQYLQTHGQYYRREQRWPDAPFWQRRQELIRLDPHSKVNAIAPWQSPNNRRSVHLSEQLSQQLYASCQPGHQAHEVVKAFADDHPQLWDQQIILGLQELVQNEVVTLG